MGGVWQCREVQWVGLNVCYWLLISKGTTHAYRVHNGVLSSSTKAINQVADYSLNDGLYFIEAMDNVEVHIGFTLWGNY